VERTVRHYYGIAMLPLLLLPARRRGSAGKTSYTPGEVVLLAAVGDALVAATAGCSCCELGVTP